MDRQLVDPEQIALFRFRKSKLPSIKDKRMPFYKFITVFLK